MNYFYTRYEAKKAFPNSIVRKILNSHVNENWGNYVVFNDYSTYEDWKRCGHVRQEREMKYVMLNREDIFKIIALFESEQTLELVRVGSLTCYANLTQEQLDILDKNHFGYTVV